MLPIRTRMMGTLPQRLPGKLAAIVCGLAGVLGAADAAADMVLVSDTTLVSGNQSYVFTFNAPGPGTVTANLSNLAWPQQLGALSFDATTSNQVLSAWNDPGNQSASFQVANGTTYFAHITAAAQGPLDLGLYSLSLTFTPNGSPVPLPASGWLLLGALLMAAPLAWKLRQPTHHAVAASGT
jgi:hypothetical protein